MRIETPPTGDADELADRWVELADEQREHDSHLLASENRDAVREAIVRHVIAGGLLVARDGETTLGFVMFEPESGTYEQDVERGVVENLYVVPGRRGEGIGSALLSAATEALAEAGADVVALEVMADNERARRFYRRHGFEPHRVEFEMDVEAATDTHSKDAR